MKFTLSWLKDHLETPATLDQIVEKLTAIGLEVEHVDDKAALKPFVIAKVLSAAKHPDADKLQVLMVDTGAGPDAIGGGIGPSQAPGDTGVKFYVRVDDLEAGLARASELGADTLAPPMDLPGGYGRIAVVSDPDGNPVGLWA